MGHCPGLLRSAPEPVAGAPDGLDMAGVGGGSGSSATSSPPRRHSSPQTSGHFIEILANGKKFILPVIGYAVIQIAVAKLMHPPVRTSSGVSAVHPGSVKDGQPQ